MTDDPKNGNGQGKEEKKPIPLPYPEKPAQRDHTLKIGRKTLNYHTTASTIPLTNAETGEVEAQIFYTAYTVNSAEGDPGRPLMFAFNGGPGSASVWLHLGALGPRRARMNDDGSLPPAPYQLVDNPLTWLEHCDLVFVDPVGTGYSRATKTDLNKKFWNLNGDLDSMSEFIRLYLTRYHRWGSPLFLAGESYGSTRVAGLAGKLVDKGITFNGVLLVSTVLNFQTLWFDTGNDLPYLLFLPTYTATAWYHQKLPADLQQRPLREVVQEVEEWVINVYSVALMRGDSLPESDAQQICQQLVRYTGLEPQFVENSKLRINIHRFCKELLRKEKRTVGRLDSRLKGFDALNVTEYAEFDPAMAMIMPPYTTLMNQYARTELGFHTDIPYEVLSYKVNESWEWERGQYADTSDLLRSAFAKNPHMKVFAALGYYDLATPHFATMYTLNHMGLDPSVRANIHTADYEAGHMMYIDVASLKKLKQDVADFIQAAL